MNNMHSTGRLTADDLLKFAGMLKPEPRASEVWKIEEQFTREITGNVRASMALGMLYELNYVTSASTDAYSWRVTMRNYNRLRYYSHLSRCRSLPRRKLRKCYLRKVDRFLKRERRRYHL